MVDKISVNKGENDHQDQYLRLLRIRRVAMVAWSIPPPLALMFDLDDDYVWIFCILWFALSGATYLFMRINDVCPWCKQSFYVKIGRVATGFDYMFRTRCANCGEPSDRNIKNQGVRDLET